MVAIRLVDHFDNELFDFHIPHLLSLSFFMKGHLNAELRHFLLQVLDYLHVMHYY